MLLQSWALVNSQFLSTICMYAFIHSSYSAFVVPLGAALLPSGVTLHLKRFVKLIIIYSLYKGICSSVSVTLHVKRLVELIMYELGICCFVRRTWRGLYRSVMCYSSLRKAFKVLVHIRRHLFGVCSGSEGQLVQVWLPSQSVSMLCPSLQ